MALDRVTGAPLVTFDVRVGRRPPVLLVRDLLHVVDRDGGLHAFGLDGARAWRLEPRALRARVLGLAALPGLLHARVGAKGLVCLEA